MGWGQLMQKIEVQLGDVLMLERIPVDINPDAEYRQIGIRSFGNGIFHREPCLGSDLSKLKYFEVHPDRLIVSNIMAWEGATGVSTESETGFVGSARFLSYRPTADVDIRYLNYYFQSPDGISLIRSASTGTVARNQTLSPKNFERQVVRLPELAEQRRVADRLDTALSRQARALSAVVSRAEVTFGVFDAKEAQIIDQGLMSGWNRIPLGEVAEINPRTKRPEGEEEVAFVPMAAVSGVTGEIEYPERVRAFEVKSGYKMFCRGDIIFARITPCMQNGKSAIFEGDFSNYGFGSTEFHVIRPGDMVDARWLHRIVRTRRFRELAIPYMTGTAGQQRISTKYLQEVEIPVPDIDQQHAAIDKFDSLQKLRLEFRAMHLSQIDSLKALRPAVLQAAFSGQL